MAARKKAGGQTPESTNRNHIGCSCGILPVAALLEFIGFHLIKNLMSDGKATLPTELLYMSAASSMSWQRNGFLM